MASIGDGHRSPSRRSRPPAASERRPGSRRRRRSPSPPSPGSPPQMDLSPSSPLPGRGWPAGARRAIMIGSGIEGPVPPGLAGHPSRDASTMPTTPPRATAAVATPHPAAAEAGREVLSGGGNAVDAAVSAMLACCVAMPGAVGLGGYGGSLVAYLAADRRTVAVDFD